jgi:hypothetical protein
VKIEKILLKNGSFLLSGEQPSVWISSHKLVYYFFFSSFVLKIILNFFLFPEKKGLDGVMMWNPKNVVFVCCCFSILILKSCFAGHHVLGAKSREMESFEKNLLNTLEVYFDLEKCERLKIDLLAI